MRYDQTSVPHAHVDTMSTVVQPSLQPRLDRARRRLTADGVDALLIFKSENRIYLTGFTGSAGVALVGHARRHLLIDFRYLEQAAEQAPAWERVRVTNLVEGAAELVKSLGARRVGFEAEALTVAQLNSLRKNAPGVEFVALEGIDRMRWQKEEEEVRQISRALRVAEAAFRDTLALVRPGVRERELAAELEYRMRRGGADRNAFESIVASGARSALPHGVASDKTVEARDFVTFDFGAVVDGYCSDCTRTVVIGKASEEQRKIYSTVVRALETAKAGLRAGITGRDADALARDMIVAAGYGDAFGHSLGHGVGLAVHEGPTLSPREEAVLEPGAVVTVEPGIYLPGKGGVRVEDLVVLRDGGCDVLTTLVRDLIEI
jgi:Xaa-Pro aminopeptidase